MPRSYSILAAEPAASCPLVAVMVDRIDWHARELVGALTHLGARAVAVRLDRCGFATRSASGLRIPGLDDRLPDAVLVRTVPGGSFEAVTMRLGVLHALRELGV